MTWIRAVAAHATIVNTRKLDSISVVYKGCMNYHVVGHIGTDFFVLAIATNESDASDAVNAFEALLSDE